MCSRPTCASTRHVFPHLPLRYPAVPDHALLHAWLAAAEHRLAAGDLRLARMRACLVRQRAFRLNPKDGAATPRAMEYVQAQWQRQRRTLLDQLWIDGG